MPLHSKTFSNSVSTTLSVNFSGLNLTCHSEIWSQTNGSTLSPTHHNQSVDLSFSYLLSFCFPHSFYLAFLRPLWPPICVPTTYCFTISVQNCVHALSTPLLTLWIEDIFALLSSISNATSSQKIFLVPVFLSDPVSSFSESLEKVPPIWKTSQCFKTTDLECSKFQFEAWLPCMTGMMLDKWFSFSKDQFT